MTQMYFTAFEGEKAMNRTFKGPTYNQGEKLFEVSEDFGTHSWKKPYSHVKTA